MGKDLLQSCFGNHVTLFIPVVGEVLIKCSEIEYSFLKLEDWEELRSSKNSIEKMNKVYWIEMLNRLHLASVASIRRNYGWMKSMALLKNAGEVTGYTACLRSLLEAAADSMYSIVPPTNTLAREHNRIHNSINGVMREELYGAPDMEDFLIAFTHGRKLHKHDDFPDSHRAKQSYEFLNILQDDVGIDGVRELNNFLNGIVHPAADSVFFQVSVSSDEENEIFKFNPKAETETILQIEKEYAVILCALPSLCLDPALIALRVLHKFGRFPMIRSLKKYPFQQQDLWGKVQALLNT
jgi:hypothetical protein